MRSHTEYLMMHTDTKRAVINITDKVRKVIDRSGVKEGLCLISAMHITASIFVNDEESGIKQDILEWLERLAPFKENYLHHHTGEDNADAHLKNLLMGHQITLPITKGRFDSGPWQEIFYGEWDGQRDKRIIIKIIGE